MFRHIILETLRSISRSVPWLHSRASGVCPTAGGYALIAIPSTAPYASSMDSLSVGCACTVNIISSTVPSSSITAIAASAISSVAHGPMIVHAQYFAILFRRRRCFTKPSCEPTIVALEVPAMGNLPTFTAYPFSLA